MISRSNGGKGMKRGGCREREREKERGRGQDGVLKTWV